MKKGQTWSLEAFAAVMVFLTAIVIFYTLVLAQTNTNQLGKESEHIMETLSTKPMFLDNKLDEYEKDMLKNMNCTELKKFLGTSNNVAIYFKNKDGNIIRLDADTNTFGCEGLSFES